jgi:hypothetical protein
MTTKEQRTKIINKCLEKLDKLWYVEQLIEIGEEEDFKVKNLRKMKMVSLSEVKETLNKLKI